MRLAIIGRTEILYETAEQLYAQGYEIGLILSAKEACEYTKGCQDFKKLARNLGVPFIESSSNSEVLEVMSTLPAFDVGISVNYPRIISQEVIDCFRLGILNAHGGDLPRYRGNACQAWAILEGEERVGLCIHKMVGGELDSGNIIARDYCPIEVDTKVTKVHRWMSDRVPALFRDALERLAADPKYVLETQSQDPRHSLRCYPRRPEDGRIKWGDPAVHILRLINACNKPYAGAFCEHEGAKVIIWDACLVDDGERFLAVPGQVTRVGKGSIEVAAGDGKIRVMHIEQDGVTMPPDRLVKSLRARLT